MTPASSSMTHSIYLHDLKFKLLLKQEEILKAIGKMARQINADFKDEKPVFLVILKGAFMFASELVKAVNRDVDIEFIRVKSYEGKNCGEIDSGLNAELKVKDRVVVILEDIVDTGNTIEHLDEKLKEMGARKIKVATLFLKPEAYKKKRTLNYVGLEIPNEFVVGFGLDYDERGRGFKDLYQLIENQ